MPQNIKTKQKILKEKIATARKELHSLWAIHGCTNAEVLAGAVKMDELCNQYQRLICGKQSDN